MKKQNYNSINFESLVGSEAVLYQCNGLNTFQLGSVLFEVVEDENDGYRSSMQEIKIIKTNEPVTNKIKLDRVTILPDLTISGYRLVGKDSEHLWLQFGTDNSDDYYPSFVYRWTPKESEELKAFKKLLTK